MIFINFSLDVIQFLGGVTYLKEKDNDSLLDVIGSISKISNKADSTHKMIELIDDDKTIKSSRKIW